MASMLKEIRKEMHGGGGALLDIPWHIRKAFRNFAHPISMRARDILFHAGDAGDGCYIVRRGVVKASVIAKDGQERLLAVLGPGALIGELALIDDEPRSATISAMRDCRLLHLPKSSFFRLADEHPMVYRQALRILAQRLRGTNDTVVALGTITVAGRVARAFAALANGLGDELPNGSILLNHKISQTDIAGMAGVARENASRAINELIREGIISRDKSLYVIANPEELLDMATI
jgi:CRP-like cAMP-binding protein